MAATTANTVSTHHWASSALQIARHSSALLSIGTGSRFRTRPGNANGHPSALASALASIGALASIDDWHQHSVTGVHRHWRRYWNQLALASALASALTSIGTLYYTFIDTRHWHPSIDTGLDTGIHRIGISIGTGIGTGMGTGISALASASTGINLAGLASHAWHLSSHSSKPDGTPNPCPSLTIAAGSFAIEKRLYIHSYEIALPHLRRLVAMHGRNSATCSVPLTTGRFARK